MSAGSIWVTLRYVLPSRVTAQMIASVLSAACMAMAFLVFTMSTSLPLLNMGVMTMKMMSMTSMTSTIGVTLMSATGGGALYFAIFLSRWIVGSGTGGPSRAPL